MPKKITLTIEVEDDFDSFSDLETLVNHQGQKLKKELCEKLVDDFANKDSLSCPKCSHTESIARGHKERKLKTIFGNIEIQQNRRQCKSCGRYFFPIGAWLRTEGNVTLRLKEMATLCAASWPYEVASRTLERLTGVSLCAKEIQLLTEAVHEVTARSQIAQETKEDETEGFIEALSTTTKASIEQLDDT